MARIEGKIVRKYSRKAVSKETRAKNVALPATSGNQLIHVDAALVTYSRIIALGERQIDTHRITDEERELFMPEE